jgi:hypothetical protein
MAASREAEGPPLETIRLPCPQPTGGHQSRHGRLKKINKLMFRPVPDSGPTLSVRQRDIIARFNTYFLIKSGTQYFATFIV